MGHSTVLPLASIPAALALLAATRPANSSVANACST